MICPYCYNETQIPSYAFTNVGGYQKTKLVKTECCGHGVYLHPPSVFTVTVYHGDRKKDDWDEIIK